MSNRGRVFGSRCPKGGGELGLIGDDDNGEECAGLCGDEKSRLNIGMVANISNVMAVY